MYYHKECKPNELYVGNAPANRDFSYLSKIKYRLGEQAYDLDGKKLDPLYTRPLLVDKADFNKYNNIMESVDYSVLKRRTTGGKE